MTGGLRGIAGDHSRVALIVDGREHRLADLERRIGAIAASAGRDVEPGSAVAVFLNHPLDLVTGVLALLEIGALPVFVHGLLAPARAVAAMRAFAIGGGLWPGEYGGVTTKPPRQWPVVGDAPVDALAAFHDAAAEWTIAAALHATEPDESLALVARIDTQLSQIAGELDGSGAALVVQGRRALPFLLTTIAAWRNGSAVVATSPSSCATFRQVLELATSVGARSVAMPLGLLRRAPFAAGESRRSLTATRIMTWGEDVIRRQTLAAEVTEAAASWKNLYGFPAPFAQTRLMPDPLSADGDALVHSGRLLAPFSGAVVGVDGRGAPRNVIGDLCVEQATAAARGVTTPIVVLPSGRSVQSTGFQARRLSSGELELRGRGASWAGVGDQTVSSHDLAAALSTIDGVVDCAVTANDAITGSPRLTAFIVSGKPIGSPVVQTAWSSVVPVEDLRVDVVALPCLPRDRRGEVETRAYYQAMALRTAEPVAADELEAISDVVRAALNASDAVAVNETVAPIRQRLAIDALMGGKPTPVAETHEPARIEPRRSAPSIVSGGALPEADQAPLTLAEALARSAEGSGDRRVILIERDGTTRDRSYAELYASARAALASLRAAGMRPGDLVILQTAGIDATVRAFWASVLGGFVVVPVADVEGADPKSPSAVRLRSALRLADHPVVVTTRDRVETVEATCQSLEAPRARVVDLDAHGAADATTPHTALPSDPVLLLLTSGSTAAPKAAMLTHRNILSMSKGISRLNDYHRDQVSLNWMPLDHVGGLVMFHVRDTFLGCTQIQTATDFVLADPLRWLELMDRYHVTVSWAPNFAYALINERADQLSSRRFDLSRVRLFANGGEVVNVDVAMRFLELLQSHGLSTHAIRPGFGMTETSSSIISSERFGLGRSTGIRHRPADRGASDASAGSVFAEVGIPAPGIEFRIVDSTGTIVPEGTEGLLEIRGPQVFAGYFGDADATRAAFTGDGWLTTGDLGFAIDGRLTISGRAKDVVIVRGVKFASEEIEAIVERLDGVAASRVAAVAVHERASGREQLAIFFSPDAGGDGRSERLHASIGAALVDELGISPDVLIPIPIDEMPTAALGKIQRGVLRRDFEDGRYDETAVAFRASPQRELSSVPDWFFEKVWSPRPIARGIRRSVTRCIVFEAPDRAATDIARDLQRLGVGALRVTLGATSGWSAADHYVIGGDDPAAYANLVGALDDTWLEHIVHLWAYGAPPAASDEIETTRAAQLRGVHSVRRFVDALRSRPRTSGRLTVVSSCGQITGQEESPACHHATLSGLIKSIAAESPWLECRSVDVEPGALDAATLLEELRVTDREIEIVYRKRRRLVPRLRRLPLPDSVDVASTFPRGGLVMLVGGLGGIGTLLASFLIQQLDARLLITGRTALEAGQDHANDPAAAQRATALRRLRDLGGAVAYERADIADREATRSAIERAEARFGLRLSTVINLAGAVPSAIGWDRIGSATAEHDVARELDAQYCSRVYGLMALYDVLADRTDATIVTLSSVNGFFGGTGVAAYASAAAFADAFSGARRLAGFSRARCIDLSLWPEIGMAAGMPEWSASLAATKGFLPITAADGVASLVCAASQPARNVLVGLDAGHALVQARLDGWKPAAQIVRVFVSGTDESSAARLEMDAASELHRPIQIQVVTGALRSADGAPLVEKWLSTGAPADDAAACADAISPVERTLLDIVCEILGRRDITLRDDFFRRGGDSILAIQVVARAAQAGLKITPREVFEQRTVAGMAAVVGAAASATVRPQRVAGPLPLTPIQQWLLEQELPAPAHFNLSLLLRVNVDRDIPLSALQQAATALAAQHDVFALRFTNVDGTWTQLVEADGALAAYEEDLSSVPDDRLDAAIRRVADDRQRQLDLGRGPLASLTSFALGGGRPPRLLLVCHHLLVDTFSLRILVEDLETLLTAILRDAPAPPLVSTAPFSAWAAEAVDAASDASIRADESFWIEMLSPPSARVPRERDGADDGQRRTNSDREGENTEARAAVVSTTLEASFTADIEAIPDGAGIEVKDLLLAALALTVFRWTRQSRVAIDVEGNSRTAAWARVDVSRTVGWMTSMYPVAIDLDGVDRPARAATAVQDVNRRIGPSGSSYGLLRYDGTDDVRARLGGLATPEISFNYLGRLDPDTARVRLFEIADESAGETIAAANPRRHLIDVVALIREGELRVLWKYCAALHADETIRAVAADFLACVRSVVEDVLAGDVESVDTSLLALDPDTLRHIAAIATFES